MSSNYSTSSIPQNPTLRSSTFNTVVVVPLLSTNIIHKRNNHNNNNDDDDKIKINRNTHSYKSFQALFRSLADINYQEQQNNLHHHHHHGSSSRHPTTQRKKQSKTHKTMNSNHNSAIAAIHASQNPSTDITIIIPNANLTPPSEFSYDDTPLKSHDWSIGSQRLCFVNGLESVQALDRFKSFSLHHHNSKNGRSRPKIPSHYGHFVDLYPSRGVSAVIGVINVLDCQSSIDFEKAQEELQYWKEKFTPHLHYEKSFWGTGGTDSDSPKETTTQGTKKKNDYIMKDITGLDENGNPLPSYSYSTEDIDDCGEEDDYEKEDEMIVHYSPMAPKHYITQRLFIFDSFSEQAIENKIITHTSKDVVAFPPLIENNIMNLHLNVVVNDLAMNIFMMMEKRIRVIDGLMDCDYYGDDGGDHHEEIYNKSKKNRINRLSVGSTSATTHTNSSGSYVNYNDQNNKHDDNNRSNVGAILSLSFGSHDGEDGDKYDLNISAYSNYDDILKSESEDDFYYSTKGGGASITTSSTTTNNLNDSDNVNNKARSSSSKMSLRNLAASAVKALTNTNQESRNNNDHELTLPPMEYELQTPLDTIMLQTDDITLKDVEYIKKRNAARREKYTADLALLAGSVMDAYDRYTSAAEKLKAVHDPLWYASALEGIATSFVAMSDSGGHGADQYLEQNFQYPEKVMEAALSISSSAAKNKNEVYESTKVDKSKTTMPEAVTALLQEACDIMSRNIKLSSIYSELLLKMAWYICELEGLHLLCKWGEGFAGGDGREDAYGVETTSSISSQHIRWELTSVSKIDLDQLQKSGRLDPLLSINSVSQCRRFTEILHLTASNGGLDAYTRAVVGARCAQLCLKGVKVPKWCKNKAIDRSSLQRHTFPRKAAYFSLLAAESMSQCKLIDSPTCAAGFWAASSHLYSKESNKFDDNSSYAWASLRATVLHGMSLYGGKVASEIATNELLHLLSEITWNAKVGKANQVISSENDLEDYEETSLNTATNKNKTTESVSYERTTKKDVNKKPELVKPNKSILPKTSMFGKMSSQLLIHQSEWLKNDTVPYLILPLIEPSTMVLVYTGSGKVKLMKKNVKNYHSLSPLISLDCVIDNMKVDKCINAQKKCMAYLSKIRTTLTTLSHTTDELYDTPWNSFKSHSNNYLQINSVKVIESEPYLNMEKVNTMGFNGRMTTSTATFYNPYERNQKEATKAILVAEGEERTIAMKITNNLSAPLIIPSCELAFKKNRDIDIEAPSISFTIPPKTSDFWITFPFILVSSSNNPSSVIQDNEGTNTHDDFTFAVTGVNVTVNNRSMYIPFPKESDPTQLSHSSLENRQIPEPVSKYKGRSKKEVCEEKRHSIDFVAVPAQPKLLISFAHSSTTLEDKATIPVLLADGEIYSIPPLRIENDQGLGLGSMERLQIIAVGLPGGLPEEIIFDSNQPAKTLEDNDFENFFDKRMESNRHPPFKMKCKTEFVSLESIINGSLLDGGCLVKLQIAASHDMGDRVKNDCNILVRFRYCGVSRLSGVQIWRKREVALNIVRVKGPIISSLTFRSDLSWGSEFTDLCRSLYNQRSKVDHAPNCESIKSIIDDYDQKNDLRRVGHDSGVFVCKDDLVMLMEVTNDANATIILSNQSGNVGGFESYPMHTVRVTAGVSVKIPLVISRIDSMDENGATGEIANELIAATTLQWEYEAFDSTDEILRRKRHGRVQIPLSCIRDLIRGHDFLTTRLCKPPLVIDAYFNGKSCKDGINEEIILYPGATINSQLNANFQEWIPAELSSSYSVTLEFACARRGSGKSSSIFKEQNHGAYIWCGQVRKNMPIVHRHKNQMEHSARLCFLIPGEYVVSACVKICGSSGREEIWWVPSSKFIKVLSQKK